MIFSVKTDTQGITLQGFQTRRWGSTDPAAIRSERTELWVTQCCRAQPLTLTLNCSHKRHSATMKNIYEVLAHRYGTGIILTLLLLAHVGTYWNVVSITRPYKPLSTRFVFRWTCVQPAFCQWCFQGGSVAYLNIMDQMHKSFSIARSMVAAPSEAQLRELSMTIRQTVLLWSSSSSVCAGIHQNLQTDS